MRKSITGQIGSLVVIFILVSLIITFIANYFLTYNQMYESAGIEAVGCANITTGLVDPDDLTAYINGDSTKKETLENAVNWTVDHKPIFDSHYIVSLDGTLLVVDNQLKDEGFEHGEQFFIDEEVIEQIKQTKSPTYSEIYHFAGKDRLTGYAPIFKDHDPNKEIIALSAIDFNGDIVKDRTWNALKGSIFVGLFSLIITSMIAIIVVKRKAKPITNLTNYAKKISEGNLSIQIPESKNNDEVGELINTFNLMAKNLRELIKQLNTNTDQIAKATYELRANTEQSNQATEEINDTIEQLTNRVDDDRENILDTSTTIEEMNTNVQQIASYAENVSVTAKDAEEKAVTGEQFIADVIEQMNKITTQVDRLAQSIEKLGSRSKAINQIIEVITNISEQTNLLALNAAIEAARAGEHGRGFTVVADEVRKLAEQSTQSAQQVSELISSIQEETNTATEAMKLTKEEVECGKDSIQHAGNTFEQIKDSVTNVTGQIQDVSASLQEIASAAEQISVTIQRINEITESTSTSAQHVYNSTAEQLDSMEEIISSVHKLDKMVEESKELIKKFQVNDKE